MMGSVFLSVCPSVCLSIRPSLGQGMSNYKAHVIGRRLTSRSNCFIVSLLLSVNLRLKKKNEFYIKELNLCFEKLKLARKKNCHTIPISIFCMYAFFREGFSVQEDTQIVISESTDGMFAYVSTCIKLLFFSH